MKSCACCQKILVARSGEPPSHLSRRRFCSQACVRQSPEIRTRISLSQRGIPKSQAAREAMRGPRKPRVASAACIRCGIQKTQRKKESQVRYLRRTFCSLSCSSKIKNKGRVSPCRGIPRPSMQGSNSPAWRGGLTSINITIRASAPYKAWRRHVFQRDDYACQSCGQRGVKLHADHELPFSRFPGLRFELLNGRTLCVPCHRRTPTWGGKAAKLYANT